LKASEPFAFDKERDATGSSGKFTGRDWRIRDAWIHFDETVMELRLDEFLNMKLGSPMLKCLCRLPEILAPYVDFPGCNYARFKSLLGVFG
jgi:hypothetical protein